MATAYTLNEFVQMSKRRQAPEPQAFQFPQGNQRMLEVNFNVPSPSTGENLPTVWIRSGAMVAYTGEVSFERQHMFSHGIAHAFKKTVTDEGGTLTRATPRSLEAKVYLAEEGKVITILRLQGDSIVVNGNNLLAFEPNVTHNIVMIRKVSSIVSGGLFNVQLSGHGLVAITTHGKPICFAVGTEIPALFTDPDATVAWTGTLAPELKADVQIKSLFARGSGESLQMKFDGKEGESGVVLVQPFEEASEASTSSI